MEPLHSTSCRRESSFSPISKGLALPNPFEVVSTCAWMYANRPLPRGFISLHCARISRGRFCERERWTRGHKNIASREIRLASRLIGTATCESFQLKEAKLSILADEHLRDRNLWMSFDRQSCLFPYERFWGRELIGSCRQFLFGKMMSAEKAIFLDVNWRSR
jgi:hypothetical protein